MKKWFFGIAALIFLGLIGSAVYLRTPAGESFNTRAAMAAAKAYNVRIIRDEFGVPHVFGQTDADTAFGFGYAHAEDDWATIQDTIIAARGMTAQYKGKDSAPQDYLYDLFKIGESVEAGYKTQVSPEAQSIARAYADALNLYGAENPSKLLPAVLPISEYDVLAGFAWATPFFYRLDENLQTLFTADNRPDVSPWSQQSSLFDLPEAVRGSNAFAIAPSRSADGHTRLIANAHQPMDGPYAWYEAHLVSEEGMNTVGGTFPGMPIMAQGVTPNIAWTHTVNRPDLVDIYALTVDDEDKPSQYLLDGEWIDFERTKSKFRVKLFGAFSLPITRDVIWSRHGPVLSTPSGHYAIRYAGMAQLTSGGPAQNLGALDQWLAMNKATNMQEWRQAVEAGGVLSFNIVYGDREGNIGSVYNARMPNRIEGPDWSQILPGDKSELIWAGFRSVSDLPQLWNPDCGWVFSANATPFAITDERCNNQRAAFSATYGIEDRITNRSRRALAMIEGDNAISRKELLAYRSDTKYDPESNLMKLVVQLVSTSSDDPLVKQAQDILRNWDGKTDRTSRGAALAVITGTRALGYEYEDDLLEPMEALSETIQDLKSQFGRLDPEWGEVNRLIRGDKNLALDGGPDILRAIYADHNDLATEPMMRAFAGDTHILVADWTPSGELRVDSIHHYGSATLDVSSPHFSDQSERFAAGEFKSMAITLEDVIPLATQDYRPGR